MIEVWKLFETEGIVGLQREYKITLQLDQRNLGKSGPSFT
jgi:hypothetical protein